MRVDGDWRRRAATQAVCAALAGGGHRALFVGGAVRNAILGLPVVDVDIATDAPPGAVIALVTAAGLRAVPTGLAHGTVTVVAEGLPHEVTTFRRDVRTDGRHAVVAFTDDLAADAARRDFTMNALYATPGGEVIDPLGALPDLTARRVRFVGDPAARIAEDHLRILRFFRFHARYGDPGAGMAGRWRPARPGPRESTRFRANGWGPRCESCCRRPIPRPRLSPWPRAASWRACCPAPIRERWPR